MNDHDLAREFQTKCAMAENAVKTEHARAIGSPSHLRSSCSLCDVRTTKSSHVGPRSHTKGSFTQDYDAYSSKSQSWRFYAKSSVSRDLMLKGAMSLRGDGVVEGEIKGQVFSLGEDELVRGEIGFEAVSDPDDDECVAPKQNKLNVVDKFKHHKSTMTALCESEIGDEEAHRPRKYLQDQRYHASKKGGGGPTAPQKSKNVLKDSGSRHPLPGAPWTIGMTPSLPPGHHRWYPHHRNYHHLGSFQHHPPPHYYHQSNNRLRNGERLGPLDPDGPFRERLMDNSTAAP